MGIKLEDEDQGWKCEYSELGRRSKVGYLHRTGWRVYWRS